MFQCKMARREKLFLGSSLLHSFGESLWFWTYLFATCCYRMHANIIKNMLDKLTNMVPKWSQNLSKIDPGGLWKPLGTHPWNKVLPRPHFDDFGSNLGPPLGPVWAHFGHHFLCFCMFFWGGFLMALASIWAPKTPPKWDPKVDQNPNLRII